MKIKNLITTIALMMITIFSFAQNEDDKRVIDDAEEAIKTMKNADKGLNTFFENSSGYVVFPNVGEGAFILGAATGNGVVYDDGATIGMANLKKLDVGLQAGGQAFMQIIFFETEDEFEEFKDEEFEFSAEIQAIILDKGATKSANYSDGVVVFVKSKGGVMADLSVGGQKFSYSEF